VAEERIVVGLGASAGGLQALQEVLAGIPEGMDAALVVVQHLSPDFETRMDELLASYTRLPIKRAENDMELEGGVIYLMPPKVEMILANGRLLLSERPAEQGLWLPIDVFLRSIAEEVGVRAVGVVLSGTGSDASRGIRAIHEAGGAVIAQEPSSARFDGMPRAAIDTGVVDVVLPPRKIGEAIARYAEHAKGGERPFTSGVEREGIEGVFELLERDTGVDFSIYKASTIGRRLERRLVMTGARDVQGYLDRIKDDPEERETLYRDLLIGVTSFFRDPEAFSILEREHMTDLVRALPEGEPLRIWVAACATGEEAYSVAIAAFETFRRLERRPRLRLFATDVHRGSLEIASTGIYDEATLANIDRDLRARYFLPTEGRWRVVEDLRSSIVFAYHNVLRDAPFTKLDIVTCRNLLIYFSTEAQRKVLGLFHFALKTNGVLFLGPSETPGGLGEELAAVDRRWKLYKKRRDARLPPDLRSLGSYQPLRTTKPVRPEDILERAKGALVERFAPPYLVVSSDYALLHSGGGASKFLSHRDGAPSLNVLDMVGGELKYALAGALKRAKETSSATPVRFERVPAESSDGACRVAITASRASDGEPFLVTIEPMEEQSAPLLSTETIPDLARERIEALEHELRHMRETLQATVEEMDASNEELQATNEELIASNEELHSANEELQSVNEELYTVNAEHQQKIIELQLLSDDMEHLFRATDVHTVFLDAELRIRKFTPKMAETFNLLEQDEGRAIDCFSHRLKDERLLADVRAVREAGERVERQVEDLDGRWYLLRILPYRPREAIDGVVLTLVDVSSVRTTEHRLEDRESELAAILENSASPIYARNADGSVLMAGRSARELGIDETSELSAGERRTLETGEPATELRAIVVEGKERTFSANSFRVRRTDGASIVGVVMVDVTERERAMDREREAVAQRDRFLAMLSHELRNPIAAIANAAQVLGATSPPEGAKAANALTRQTQHVKDLLDDLLDVNRLTLQQLAIRRRPTELREAVDQAFEAIETLARERGVRVIAPDPVDLTFNADPARIAQMLTNLLVNAVKFSEQGSEVRLEISIEGERLKMRVIDHGIGIASGDHEKIFGLFYQIEEDRKRSGGGLGVGLNLARTIAEAHGGTLTAESGGRGEGATFLVELPIERARARTRSGVAAIEVPPAPLDIAVVEDQQDNRELMAMLVEMLGHRPIGIATAADAVATILRVRPSLALIDIGLPDADGYEVARRIRSNAEGSELCLVALTGYGRPADKDRSREAGFDEHVVKPISREDLVRLCAMASQRRGVASSSSSG
jgi:two-component system CheB/CheR fusion protein